MLRLPVIYRSQLIRTVSRTSTLMAVRHKSAQPAHARNSFNRNARKAPPQVSVVASEAEALDAPAPAASTAPPKAKRALKPDAPPHPTLTVIGVGGAGGNTVNNMIARQFSGVEFLVANTDAQALSQSLSDTTIQLGRQTTHGLGAGAKPDVGAAAAVEGLDALLAEIEGSHMAFVTAGMGGGTGTGAAPVIARACKDAGMLTVGIVTKPFNFEGRTRMRLAEEGIKQLDEVVDTLIVIPNQKLLSFTAENIGFADAFKMVDNVLFEGVKGVTDLIVQPGIINLDFADVQSIVQDAGRALMGTGEAEGKDRARIAAEMALHNPLLEDMSIEGATGVLISISGGQDLTLFEVDEIANIVSQSVDEDANIIFGSSFDDAMEGRVRVSVIVTGMDGVRGASRSRASTASLAASSPFSSKLVDPSVAEEEPKKKKGWW